MRKSVTNLSCKNSLFIPLLFCLFQIFFLTQINAQTLSVGGKVTALGIPVEYASITFIDINDTTNKFSALTDTLGNYQINLIVTSVKSSNSLPTKFKLEQNYPNPFSSSTDIPYQIKKESNVEVTIYDILGRVVKKFNVGQQSVGLYNVLWDGRNNFGEKVASGVYFYKLSSDGESQVKKMVFNQNAKSSFSLPHSYSSMGNASSGQAGKTQNVQGNTFTIRIQNTSTTSPLIVPDELDNVIIQNDTTVNFSLEYIPLITVDFDSLHQIIRGFGGANIVGWNPGLNYGDMTPAEVQTAFGTGYGELGFTILRIKVDPNRDTWNQNIATAKAAHDMGAIIFASPWNAPEAMTEIINGVTRVRHDMYAEYAAHLDSFCTYMASNGVPIYGISVQNEPDYGATGGWTQWTADEMFTFMRDYAQLITGAKVIAPESFQFRRNMSDPILNDSIACANLDIVGGHIYGNGLSPYPLAEQKGKEVWMTEHYTESHNSANIWSLAINVATEMNNVMLADMNAYVWWYIVRFYGPISDGQSEGDIDGTVTKRGYIMSQFSKFIRPSDYRVESSVYPSTPNIQISAYRDTLSSKEIIIAINTASTSKEVAVTLQNGTMNTYTTYTTSEFKSVQRGEDININGNKFTFTLDASSITTFVLK